MVQNLTTLFNRVEEEDKIPIKWSELSHFTKEETKKRYKRVKDVYF